MGVLDPEQNNLTSNIEPKRIVSAQKNTEKPCNRHLQKSFSDGRLVEEEMDSNASNTQVKPQKAVKFLQTLPPSTAVNQSEDSEVSDRDLPELAPINIQDYQRKGINTSKAVAQDCEEPDLGKTLSPLGSTSSLQDLMEATSTSAQPTPEPVKATWIERERQKKSVIVIKPKLEAGNIESKSDLKLNGSNGKSTSAASLKKVDSVTSAKTNETSTTNTATPSEDYVTA